MSAATAKGQDTKTVGIIGLGIMGGAIAKNLSAAGWQVIGFDIAKERCDDAKAAGAEIAGKRRGGRREGHEHSRQPAEARSPDGDRARRSRKRNCRAA